MTDHDFERLAESPDDAPLCAYCGTSHHQVPATPVAPRYTYPSVTPCAIYPKDRAIVVQGSFPTDRWVGIGTGSSDYPATPELEETIFLTPADARAVAAALIAAADNIDPEA